MKEGSIFQRTWRNQQSSFNRTLSYNYL